MNEVNGLLILAAIVGGLGAILWFTGGTYTKTLGFFATIGGGTASFANLVQQLSANAAGTLDWVVLILIAIVAVVIVLQLDSRGRGIHRQVHQTESGA
jgi:hypothetical protein